MFLFYTCTYITKYIIIIIIPMRRSNTNDLSIFTCSVLLQRWPGGAEKEGTAAEML